LIKGYRRDASGNLVFDSAILDKSESSENKKVFRTIQNSQNNLWQPKKKGKKKFRRHS
jgi:hypothetical protein